MARSERRASSRESDSRGREGGLLTLSAARREKIDAEEGRGEHALPPLALVFSLALRRRAADHTHRRNPFPCPSCPLRLIRGRRKKEERWS